MSFPSFPILISLSITVLVAALIDLREQRVPNWLTGSALLCGFVLHGLEFGMAGLGFAGLGMLCGFALLIPFYAVGGMGAGDVKLMAVVGAHLGAYAVFWVFLVTGIVGGVYAVLLLLVPQVLKVGAKNAFRSAAEDAKTAALTGQLGSLVPEGDAAPKLCYAVCIAIAVFAVVLHGGPLRSALPAA